MALARRFNFLILQNISEVKVFALRHAKVKLKRSAIPTGMTCSRASGHAEPGR